MRYFRAIKCNDRVCFVSVEWILSRLCTWFFLHCEVIQIHCFDQMCEIEVWTMKIRHMRLLTANIMYCHLVTRATAVLASDNSHWLGHLYCLVLSRIQLQIVCYVTASKPMPFMQCASSKNKCCKVGLFDWCEAALTFQNLMPHQQTTLTAWNKAHTTHVTPVYVSIWLIYSS